jgi:hypothetical protein
MTDPELLKEVEAQRKLMIAVATGGPKIDNVNDQFIERRDRISEALKVRGIADPNPHDDLWAWYGRWSTGDLPTWRSRRTYVNEIYAPLVQRLQKGPETQAPVAEPTGWTRVDRGIEAARAKLAVSRNEEDFQTVGLLCRETLISLAQAVYDPSIHEPLDGIKPSGTDAKRMLEAYIGRELSGGSNEAVRKHAKAALDLANTLVHKRTAAFREAALCAEATSSVLNCVAIVFGRRNPDSAATSRVVPAPAKTSNSLQHLLDRIRREPVHIRLDRILQLLGAESTYRYRFRREEGGMEREYELPTSSGEFRLYIVYKHGVAIQYLYVATVIGDLEPLDKRLADIRLLMNSCSQGQALPITFVIASDEDAAPLRPTAQRSLAKMKEFLPEESRSLFTLEIWDNVVLSAKEEELGLRVQTD